MLLGGATLGPASIVLFRMDQSAAVQEAHAEGAVWVWVDPGIHHYVMFAVGLICFFAFVVSLLLDLRTAK